MDVNFGYGSHEIEFSDDDEEDLLFDSMLISWLLEFPCSMFNRKEFIIIVFVAFVPEDAGVIKRTPSSKSANPSAEAKRIPPDSPTLLMYCVLWIFTLGIFIVSKVSSF